MKPKKQKQTFLLVVVLAGFAAIIMVLAQPILPFWGSPIFLPLLGFEFVELFFEWGPFLFMLCAGVFFCTWPIALGAILYRVFGKR